MTLMELLLLLTVAGILGSLGRALVGYSHGGCLVSIVVGFIGALLGRWLSAQIGLPDFLTLMIAGKPFPVVWTIIGSALFVAVLSLLSRQRTP